MSNHEEILKILSDFGVKEETPGFCYNYGEYSPTKINGKTYLWKNHRHPNYYSSYLSTMTVVGIRHKVNNNKYIMDYLLNYVNDMWKTMKIEEKTEIGLNIVCSAFVKLYEETKTLMEEEDVATKKKEIEEEIAKKVAEAVEKTMPKKRTTNTKTEKEETKTPKKKISQLMKRRVWAKHIGEEIGKHKCLCCNMTDITQLTFNCGHIVAEANGGDLTVENLIPICQSCNSSMGTQNLNEYKMMHGL